MNFLELFQIKATQFPDNDAIYYQNQSVTYRLLDNLSTKLAMHLVAVGIKQGDVIGLGLYNGLDLIVGLLGILKAGGVYLPLDPNYPSDRTLEMATDSSAKLIIVNQLSQKCFSTLKIPLYSIENTPSEMRTNNLPSIKLDCPAYIIYTSGSTGKPKGIVVSHSALKHAAISFSEVCPMPPCSILSGSISFDPSILIIIHALSTGGKVCLYNNEEGIDLKNFTQITELIQNYKADFILSTPSFYSNILNKKKSLNSLKNVFLCGEEIQDNLIQAHIALAPNANLLNAYGPSEYAIGSTVGLVYNGVLKQHYPVTIGKPFHENQIYVLNDELKPIAPREKGEFFVGGPGLAIGYLNQKELTDEKFIVCDHLTNKPLRLYRTGDMGYQLENGNFVFCGRKDFQVKINGHRVELEEIEAKILSFPAIEKVMVIAIDNKLIAFYSSDTKNLPLKNLVQFLETSLPAYMVPEAFFEIKQWPLTNNGKIDRKALVSNWYQNNKTLLQ